MIIDEPGAVATKHDFFPFGEEIAPQNDHENRKFFTGHERDKESGLDYMLARYYGANLGRFLSVDPSRKSARRTDPQSWNRFAYVGNNPLAFFDPNGEYRRSVTVKSGTTSSSDRSRTLIGSGVSSDNAIAGNSGAHLGRAHSLQQNQTVAYDVVLDDSRSPSEGATTRKAREGGLHFGKSAYNENDSGIGGEQSFEITIPTQGLEGEALDQRIEDALVHELTEAEIVNSGEGGFGNIEAHEEAEATEQEHKEQREKEQEEKAQQPGSSS